MYFRRDYDKPFGTFSIEEECEENGIIEVYDSERKYLATVKCQSGSNERAEILNFFNDVKSLEEFLDFIKVPVNEIFTKYTDAEKFAIENEYILPNDIPLAMEENDWINFIGKYIIFVDG